MSNRKYANCNIVGDGKIYADGSNKAEKFKIITMSGANIILETTGQFNEGATVLLKIRLVGGIVDSFVDAFIDIKGKIIKKVEKGYEIEFVDLPDTDREEIDELMKNACNIID